MVGKVWSDLEERYFWRTAVAHSSKRAGIDKANPEKTWDQLAYEMHRAMERLGQVRRKYTSTMLFEHYFQNIEGERRSPNAAAYVNEYLRKVGPEREVVNPRATRPRREVKKRRARKAAPPSSPTDSMDGPQEDKENGAPTELASLPTLREMDLPDPRPLSLPRPSLFDRRAFRSSQALRPLAPLAPLASAATRMLPPSPLTSPSYDGLHYVNQQGVPLGWNMVSPSMVSPYGAASYHQYQPRTPLSPESGNKKPEEVVWGYQMGKRSIPEKQSPQMPSKSQKTSATGYATHHQYPEGSGMGALVPEPASTPSVAFSQATTLGREPSASSFASLRNPQRELSAGYQFQGYSSPEAMSSIYSSVASESSALTQPASNQSVESTLFVEDDENDAPYEDVDDDENAEESGDDDEETEAEVKPDVGYRTMTYQDYHKGKFMNWHGEGPNDEDVSGGDYYAGTGPNV
ncbi:uncharacterized protein F4807DRAFT_455165 [Annulohypoxylon truncatum]|uniref:uncharacterized protein n=1 Tax=Annulohypoxylon truncatum TaxID=327061 RepID=UPI002008948E|nr:uncharacterized protein F4807DRAFT_455165 [Annulohypoxylon truncatum]KAI1214714.1 hypothetical protein F4807DRAFT_455165 [Annulohypoxylon truncatum]